MLLYLYSKHRFYVVHISYILYMAYMLSFSYSKYMFPVRHTSSILYAACILPHNFVL